MIFITHVDFVEIDEDRHFEIPALTEAKTLHDTPGRPSDEVFRTISHIAKGKRFKRHPSGEEVVIGAAVGCQKELGLVYEAWDNLEETLLEARKEIKDLKHRYERLNYIHVVMHLDVNALLEANLWTRIKWVFTGVDLLDVEYPDRPEGLKG